MKIIVLAECFEDGALGEIGSTLVMVSSCARLGPANTNRSDSVARKIGPDEAESAGCGRSPVKDSSGLERVVGNLILNACEAVCPDSGQIVITSTGNRACLEIGVWDNGPDIPLRSEIPFFNPS